MNFFSRPRPSGKSQPSRLLISATLCTALAVGLSACSQNTSPGPATEEALGVPVDAPRIEVTSTGDGERQILAFDDLDSEQTVEVEVAEGFKQTVMRSDAVDTQAPDADETTTTTLPLTGTVLSPEDFENKETASAVGPASPSASSDRHVDMTISDPQITELSAQDEIETADGFGFGWLGGNNGQFNTLLLAAPQEASDEGRAIIEQAVTKLISVAVVFPDEPVGVGAQWSVDSRVTGESTMLQTTTYHLTGREGDSVELDIEITQHPALGALSLEGQAGAEEFAEDTLEVTSSNTHSRGSLTVDLDQPLPVDGSIDYTTRVVYGSETAEAAVVQDSSTAINFSSH